jgi:hypothetical protein
MPVAQTRQHLFPNRWTDKSSKNLLVIALLAPELFNLVTEVLFRLTNRYFVYTFDVLLRFASAAGFVSVTLRGRTTVSFASCCQHRKGGGVYTRGARTFARFLRHSVHAFGVTTPRPLFLFKAPVVDPAVGLWLLDTEPD